MEKEKKIRIVADIVHGPFYLPNICWQIIDTPVFQRLRNIKQLGMCYQVYPNATHTRFEHSLGTAHLCNKLMKSLQMKYPESNITEKEIILITIAGLCHDLGHCGFSHLFEKINKEVHFNGFECHEHMSYYLLHYIWNEFLKKEKECILTREDIDLIGQLIFGSKEKAPKDFIWTNQLEEHHFIYSIVSNSETGIDLDKFDYILRDGKYTGINCSFNPHRMIEFSRLEKRDKSYVLLYDTKMDEEIKSMWYSRSELYRRVYEHRVANIYDNMIITLFKEICPYLTIQDKKFIDIFKDLKVYCMFTDDILSVIDHSMNPKFENSKQILNDIRSRNIHPYKNLKF